MKYKPSRENNFIWLLIALVALEFFNALFSQLDLRYAKMLVNISLILTVVVSVWSLQSHRSSWLTPKSFIALVIIGLMVVDISTVSNWLAPFQLLGLSVFICITIYLAWQQVMFTGEITRNTIFGAICIYILIGLLFGFVFLMAEQVFPGSLAGLDGENWQDNLQATIYYSMVTLTTLGYGDITPAAPVTRFLAYMEALVGIFYTTVLVASLIGMRLSGYHRDLSKTPDR
jgi:voltage-gated potassium channel Kch